jgi:hypothetical protein
MMRMRMWEDVVVVIVVGPSKLGQCPKFGWEEQKRNAPNGHRADEQTVKVIREK